MVRPGSEASVGVSACRVAEMGVPPSGGRWIAATKPVVVGPRYLDIGLGIARCDGKHLAARIARELRDVAEREQRCPHVDELPEAVHHGARRGAHHVVAALAQSGRHEIRHAARPVEHENRRWVRRSSTCVRRCHTGHPGSCPPPRGRSQPRLPSRHSPAAPAEACCPSRTPPPIRRPRPRRRTSTPSAKRAVAQPSAYHRKWSKPRGSSGSRPPPRFSHNRDPPRGSTRPMHSKPSSSTVGGAATSNA